MDDFMAIETVSGQALTEWDLKALSELIERDSRRYSKRINPEEEND